MGENANRLKIRLLVESTPGIHLREIQRTVGLSFTTVRHHVERLQQTKAVEVYRLGRYNRLFPRGFPQSEIGMASALRSHSSNLVLSEVIDKRPNSNAKISETTGLSKSTVSKHIRLLISLGLLQRTPSGYPTRYTVNEGSLSRLLRRGMKSLDSTVDRYVELWDLWDQEGS